MRRTIRLTESDLTRIVRRVLREEDDMSGGALPPQNNCFKMLQYVYRNLVKWTL